MQNPANQHAARFHPVKHNMLSVFHTIQPWAHLFAQTAHSWIVGEQLTAILELADVPISLIFAPGTECIDADVIQILVGAS